MRNPKFLALHKRLGDGVLLTLARLWAHCQEGGRGPNWGKVDAGYVETVAEWNGNPGELFDLLSKPLLQGKGAWIDVRNGNVSLHDWGEYNKGLISAWRNGRRGGRPRRAEANQVVNRTETGRLVGGSGSGKRSERIGSEETGGEVLSLSTGGGKNPKANAQHPEAGGEVRPHSGPLPQERGPEPDPNSITRTRTKDDEFPECAWPALKEWLAYSEQIGLVAWRAELEWHNQERKRWDRIQNWQAHASFIRTLWENDGRPMSPPATRMSGSGSQNSKKSASYWEKSQKKAALEVAMKDHPGNPKTHSMEGPTAEEKKDFREKMKAWAALNEELSK